MHEQQKRDISRLRNGSGQEEYDTWTTSIAQAFGSEFTKIMPSAPKVIEDILRQAKMKAVQCLRTNLLSWSWSAWNRSSISYVNKRYFSLDRVHHVWSVRIDRRTSLLLPCSQ